MESVKAVVEEVKCISGDSHVAPNPENSFCGGCCEGTVFTFTSAASNGRLRQRFRYRPTTVKTHGKEEVTDSVSSELRMMPLSRDTLSADGEVPCSIEDLISTLSDDASRSNGADFTFKNCQGPAQNPVDQTQLERRVGKEKSGEFCNLAEEESVAPLKQPEVLEDDVRGSKYLRGENYNESHQSGEAISKQGWRKGEKDSTEAKLDHLDPNGSTKVQYTEPFIDDRKGERTHKRYSSGEQANTSHHRKLRCAGEKEEESFATRIESARNEFGGKSGRFQARRTELRMAGLAEREGRLQIEAELRNLQARQHVTGVKWNMIRKGQAILSEQAHDVVKDLDSDVCSQTMVEVVSKKEDHGKENGHRSTTLPVFDSRGSGHVGPLAFSFISFKGGISSLQGKTFSFGGETFTRAENSAHKSEGTVPCMTTVSSTKSFCYESVGAKSMEAGHLVQEISRGQSGLGYGCISTFTADTEIKTSMIEGDGDESFITQDATWNGKSGKSLVNLSGRETMTSSNASHKLSFDPSRSFPTELKERRRESKAKGSMCNEQEGGWLAVLGNSAEGERFRDINERPRQQLRQIRPVVNDSLRSISLDWYGSPRNEDTNEDSCTDNDTQYLQNLGAEADCSPRSTACSGDGHQSNDGDTPVSTDGTFGHWKDSMEHGTQKLKEECKIKLAEVSDLEAEHQEDRRGTAAFQENPFCKNMHRIEQSETENQEEAGVHNEACRVKSQRDQPDRKCDSACSRQRKLPIRRQVWSRSFKKKTVDRVRYFEKWLRRGKRKAYLKKRFCKFGGTKTGVNRVDTPQHSLSLGLQAEEVLDRFSSYSIGKRRVTSPASLKNGYEAYHVRKESGTLEAAVTSDLCGRTVDSNFLDSLRGGSNPFEISVSSAKVEPESFDNGRPILRSDRSQALGNGEGSLSRNVDRKERPDSTKATGDGNLTNQEFVGSPEKYAAAPKISTGNVETAHISASTNIPTFQSTQQAKSRLYSSAFPSHNDGITLTERKYEFTKTVNKEQKSFGAQKSRDCVDVRSPPSTCGHRDSLQEASGDMSPITQPLGGAESYRFLLEKSLSDEKVPQDCVKGDERDATNASTSATSSEESKNPSFLVPACSDEAAEDERLVSRMVQHNGCRGHECQEASGLSSSEKDFASKRFCTDCAGSALEGAVSQESFRRSEASAADDIPKPVTSRKQKAPIVVRVRNGLASGWLLQSFIWKKFGKQRAKAVDLQSPPSKDVSRKENIEPLLTSTAGLANTHVVGAWTATLNASPRGLEEKGVDSPDQSKIRVENPPRTRQEVEGVETSNISSNENVVSATVRGTPTASKNTSVHEFCLDSENDKAKSASTPVFNDFTHISAFEYSPDVDEKAERKILAQSESLAVFEARNSEVRTLYVGVEAANLCHKDLQQQSFCKIHDTQAWEPEILGIVNKDISIRKDGILSGKSAKVLVTNQGENQFSPSVDSVAVCVDKKCLLSEASPKVWESRCQNGVTPVNSSKDDGSPACSGFGSAELCRRFEDVSESFSGQKRHQNTENNLKKSVDHTVGRAHGRSGPVHKPKCELSSEYKMHSPVRPDSAVSADAHGEDILCPITLDPPLSGEAVTLSLFTDIESREKDPYERLSGMMPHPASTNSKDVPPAPQGSLNCERCKSLSPAIFKPENASSSSLRHDSCLTTNCQERRRSPGEKKSKNSTILRRDNSVPKSRARFGFASISQPADTEKNSDGASDINQLVISYTGSKPWSSPLDERNAFHVPDTLDAPGRYDDKSLTGQPERLEEAASFEAQSVPSSTRHDEPNNTDAGKGEESTSSISHETWILEKQVAAWESEEAAKIQTDLVSSTCQPDNQNSFDSKTPGTSASSKTSWTGQRDEHMDSDVRSVQGLGRAVSWLPQDQDSHWRGPTGEKGNATMECTTDAAQLSAVQGFCDFHSHSLEWNGTESRETQALDQHGTCISTSQNQLMDTIPSNEPQRSTTAATFRKPVNRLRLDTCEIVQRRQAWNLPSSPDFQAHNHGVQKGERGHSSFTDGHTQDEVFLERFSSSNDSHKNKMRHKRKSSVGSLRAPTVPAATCVREESKFFSMQDAVVPGRQNSSSFHHKVEPPVPRTSNSHFASLCAEPPAPHPNQTIHPSASNVDSSQQPLPYDVERDIPKSHMVPNQAYHTYERGLLADFRNSLSSVSPCSSINGNSENTSDKISLKPKFCLHGSTGYDPGVPWGHYSDEALDFKAFPAQSCIQPMPSHLPATLVHNPTLTLNSQTFRSSCHTAQPLCPCNNSSSCSNSSCNNQFPVCGPMLRPSQCGSEHALGHHIPAYISARPTETVIIQHVRVPVSHGYVGQYAPKVSRYAPPQTMPTRQSSWPAADKHIASNMCGGDPWVPDCNSAFGKKQDSGLVWLTGEEMNLIRELRQSVGKDSTRSSECLADPEPSPIMSFSSAATGVREGSFYAGGSNISHANSISRYSNYSTCTSPRQIHEAGTTAHMELTRDSLLKRWITSMQKAASIIQRAWRALLRRRREKAPSIKALPKNMKDFHDLIRTRHSSKNYRAPSFDNFVRSMKHIQARTEGARIRRRLKSRRLQAIIMEIKEIRNLLSEMSGEANSDASAPYLYPQLYNQLQQKILQFHTALTGPQMQARFLLRRGPATPLVLYPSKSPAVSALSAVASLRVGDQHHSRMLTAFPEPKTLHTQPVTSRRRGSRGKVRSAAVKSGVPLTDTPETAELLPWYFLAQRSPSKAITGQSSPTEFTSSFHESHIIKKESEERALDSSSSQIVNKGILPYQQVPLKSATVESSINEIYEEQPLSLMRRRKTSDLSFDEIPIGTANAGIFTIDIGPAVDLSNKPKRPFLKRKSIIMAPQKLDWSKVKPMVSSRLEPELKTKLSYCRHTKAVDRPSVTSTSRRKRENYSQVKSRLFSYEDPSPISSKGNASRARYNEKDNTETSPRSRGGTFVDETSESGESSRLAEYSRPASHDLLRLKSQVQADTEAELAYHRVQASTDPQIEHTYSTCFDSARYLHKLENSEQAAKDSSMQAAQPRTQRIRLRLIPGSEENEPGRVLVQKIENQEEEMPDLWHDQRIAMRNRRRQSHSHRYASYRESQGDVQPSSKQDEPRRPSSPPDRRTLKAFASSKMDLASKELEEMFERVIAAKCGRNITLSELFDQTQR